MLLCDLKNLNMSGAPWKTDIQVSGLEVKLKNWNYVGEY